MDRMERSPKWQQGVQDSIKQLQRSKLTAQILYTADYVTGIEAAIFALEALLVRGGPALTPVD